MQIKISSSNIDTMTIKEIVEGNYFIGLQAGQYKEKFIMVTVSYDDMILALFTEAANCDFYAGPNKDIMVIKKGKNRSDAIKQLLEYSVNVRESEYHIFKTKKELYKWLLE